MANEENEELAATGAEALRWSVLSVGDEIDVAVAGEMDLATTGPLTLALTRVLDAKPVSVNVDLRHVSFLDSSGVRCLVGAAQRAESVGSHLVVRNPTPMVLRVMEMCGVNQLLLADGRTDDDSTRVDSQTDGEPRAFDDA